MANLGAAHIGGYMDFINEMLDLRKQRLEEARYQQLERMQNQQQMLSTIGNISEGIQKAGQTYQENQMANQLMGEYYGGGSGVSPDVSFGGAKSLVDQGLPMGSRRFTGGMPELKMRMAMDENLSQADYRSAMIDRMGQNLKFQKSKYLVDQAQKAKSAETKPLQDAFKNMQSYLKDMRVYDDAIANAGSPEDYQNAVDAKVALNQAAQQRGLKVDPLDPASIPPYLSPDDKTALANQQTAVSEARTKLEEAKKAEPGFLDKYVLPAAQGALGMDVGGPTYHDKAVQSAQQLYEQEQQKLHETLGASFYGEKPVTPKKSGTLKEAGGAGAQGDNIGLEVGTRRHSASTGRTQEWNGREWVEIE